MSGILAAVVSGVYLGSRDTALTDADDPPAGLRLLAGAHVHPRVAAVHPRRAAVPERARRARPADAASCSCAGRACSRSWSWPSGWRTSSPCSSSTSASGGATRSARSERLVVGWSGMRGAISLAVALSIPLTRRTGSRSRPRRDHLPDAVRHRGDARRPGPHAARAHPPDALPGGRARRAACGDDALPHDRGRARAHRRAVVRRRRPGRGDGRAGAGPVRAARQPARRRVPRRGRPRRRRTPARGCACGWTCWTSSASGWPSCATRATITTPLMNVVQQDLDLESSRLQRRLATA